MGIKIDLKIEGTKEVLDAITKAARRYPEAAAVALYEECLAIMAESVKLVPVDTGRLRATAYVAPPKFGRDTECRVGYGTRYAVYVHERTDVRHTNGEAKFLEKPAMAAQRGFAARMQKRMEHHIQSNTDPDGLPRVGGPAADGGE